MGEVTGFGYNSYGFCVSLADGSTFSMELFQSLSTRKLNRLMDFLSTITEIVDPDRNWNSRDIIHPLGLSLTPVVEHSAAEDEQGRSGSSLFEERVKVVRALVGDTARVVADYDVEWIDIRPYNERAVAIRANGDLSMMELVGLRMPVWLYSDDPEISGRLLEAVVDGRVTERHFLARSSVTITLDDGSPFETEAWATLLIFLIPLPGWKKWARREEYESYRR